MAERDLNAHIWERDDVDWYVEPVWVSRRLFEEEPFVGGVYDPACGRGNVMQGARDAGIEDVLGSDIRLGMDFLTWPIRADNFACNPPFDQIEHFARKACGSVVPGGKVALICPVRRLAAAGKWIQPLPLRRIWFLTPRPSMPPGAEFERLAALGKEPSGGTQDYCWLVFQNGFSGQSAVGWLHRDGGR